MEKKTIAVIGMGCAACAANVERRLNQLDGIHLATVNYASRTALVEFDPKSISPQQMKEEIVKIGYDLAIDEEQSVLEIEKSSYRQLLKRVLTSWLFAILVMSISMKWIRVDYANQVMLIIALANLVYCGKPFFVNAWKLLTHGMTNMDTLVAMSTGVSFLFSTFNTFWGEQFWGSRGISWNTYFDASVMIITFVLTGKLMEERAKKGTASAIRALMGLAPKTARLATGEEVPISTLQKGDVIEVKAGEKIPVDGTITQGAEPTIDESMITGEPIPAFKNIGEKVFAGTIMKQGSLQFRAEQIGKDTMLANIIRMVQESPRTTGGRQGCHDICTLGVSHLRRHLLAVVDDWRRGTVAARRTLCRQRIGDCMSLRHGTGHPNGFDGWNRKGGTKEHSHQRCHRS